MPTATARDTATMTVMPRPTTAAMPMPRPITAGTQRHTKTIMRLTTATATAAPFARLSPTTVVPDITAAGGTGGIVIGEIPISVPPWLLRRGGAYVRAPDLSEPAAGARLSMPLK